MKEDRLTHIYTCDSFEAKKEVAFIELSKAIKYVAQDRISHFKSLNLYHSGGKWVTENGRTRYKVSFINMRQDTPCICAYINEIPLEEYWEGKEDDRN